MKSFQKNWILGGLLVIVLVTAGYFVGPSVFNKSEVASTPSSQEQTSQIKASVEVRYNQDQVDVFVDIALEEGKTALDLTKKVVEVITSGEGEMAFVTIIGGTEADATKNEFWELLINGESAQVGAGSYEIKDGDEIYWRISTF